MIDLGQPALHADGVTVFADHADDTVFFYLPDAPRLRTDADGEVELSLVKYRLDADATAVIGNGMLSFTVDLGASEDRLARIRSKIASRTGRSGITLAPVSAESGRTDIVLLGKSTVEGVPETDAGQTFVLQPLAVGAPMLVGDKAATFSTVLSAEGTTLVEQAIRKGGLPVGVVYALQVLGIRPALRATVTARWHDVYSYYENRLHGGKLLLATDIGATVEELVRSEAITVEVDELIPVAERSETDRRAVDEVQRYVIEKLFTPTLGQAPPAADAEAEGLAAIGSAIKDVYGYFSLHYTLRQVDRNELKTFRYELATAQAETLTLSPQGSFAAGLSELTGARVDRLIREIEPTASAEMIFDVGSARDLAGEDLDRIEVVMVYGDQRQDFVLDPETPRRRVPFWFDPRHGRAVSWAYTLHFRPDTGAVDQLSSGPHSTDQRVIRIDPRELYDRVEMHVVANGIPFETYPTVIVDLRFTAPAWGFVAEHAVLLRAGTPEGRHAERVAPGSVVIVQRRVRYFNAATGEVLTLPNEVVPAGELLIGNPTPDIVDVQLLAAARFGTAVARLIVELRPRNAPERVDTRVLTADNPVSTWSWAVSSAGRIDPGEAARAGTPAGADLASRKYDYRVTVHTVAGEFREGDWQPGPPGKLIVGEGFAALRQVSLYLVGAAAAGLSARGLLAVKVRFAYADATNAVTAEHEALVTDPTQPISWTYPVATPDQTAYTVQLTAVRTDGQLRPQPPVTTSDLIVIAPVPDGQ